MNLSEMATFVCETVRYRDADAVAQCKAFLRQRYKVIAQAELWNDLLFEMPFTWEAPPSGFDPELPSTWDDTAASFNQVAIDAVPYGNFFSRRAGIWHLPPSVDRVLALRRTDQPVAVDDQFQMFHAATDIYSETGTPVSFHTMGQVVQDFVGEQGMMLGVLDTFPWDTVTPFGGFIVCAENSADIAASAQLRYTDADGRVRDVTIALTDINDPAPGVMTGQNILSLTVTPTIGDVVIAFFVAYSFGAIGSGTVTRIAAGDSAADLRPRIRVYPIPTVETDMRALVKIKARVLSNDNDEVAIRGIEDCLLALAQGDMLKRARQHLKAERLHAEGLALLEQAKKAHTWHEARHQQIVPEVYDQSGQAGRTCGPWDW